MAADLSPRRSRDLATALVHMLLPLAWLVFGFGHVMQFIAAWFGAMIIALLFNWATIMHRTGSAIRSEIRVAQTGGTPGAALARLRENTALSRRGAGVGRVIVSVAIITTFTFLLCLLTWPVMIAILAMSFMVLVVASWGSWYAMRAANRQFQRLMKARIEKIKVKTVASPGQDPAPSPRLSSHPVFSR